MSWWSTSWLPSIPSIDFSLPSGIQKRFISFTLRRTLGHLLKPGQLDIQQVDSQIGSGYVQIRDVELDNDAINSMLAGLPIELHDGSLGKITARIPWPNPLTSTIGLSLESLHLTFNIVPTVSKTTSSSRLAESITSVAETFVHDELNDYDEAALRESMYSDADLSQSLDRVPGGLDPFMPEQGSDRDLDPSGVSIFATLVERLLARFEFDAKDLKITLVHPSHSSITLNVPSIRYHTELKEEGPTSSPSNVQGVTRTVQVSGVNITTRNLRPLSPQSLTSPAASLSTYRSSNVESSTMATPTYSPPYSPALSDSSEMDEDTTMMMSQSIIGLPVRPISPASSVASSMYASAISTAPAGNDVSGSPVASIRPSTPPPPPQSPSPSPPIPPPIRVFTREIEDETILSFGSEPIVVRLVAPPPARTPAPTSPNKSESPDISHTNSKFAVGSEALKLEVTMGVIAVALRAKHARSLLEMAELWTSHSPESTAQTSRKDAPSSSSPSIFSRYDASLHMRGIVVIVLPLEDSSNTVKDGLATFYNRPLIPPQLEHGYVRLHLDNISATLSSAPIPPSAPSRVAASPSGTSMTGRLSLDDISAFAFLRSTDQDQSPSLYASPILITDPHLGSQYPPTHEHPDLSQANSQHPLPAFDVVDWTDQTRHPHNAKLSNWRTKLPQGQAVSAPSTPMNKVKELASSPPSRSPVASSPLRSGVSTASRNASAIEVVFTVVSAASSSRSSRARGKAPEIAVDVDVQLAPLHIFCDASLLLNKANPERLSEPLLFLEELSLRDPPPEAPSSFLDHDWDAEAEGEDADEEEDDTPPATPRAQRGGYAFREQERDRERERQRLERLVLEDLDLELDYRQKVPETGRPSIARVDSWRKKQTKTKKASALKLNITFPVLRVEVRTPPPPKFTVRSGVIVLDIHDLRLTPGDQAPPQSTTSARFAETEDPLLAEAFSSPRSSDTSTLLSASWQRLTFACQSSGASKAQMILSLGPLPLEVQSRSREDGIAIGSPVSRAAGVQQARPQFMITKTVTSSVAALPTLSTTVVTVDIPSVHVHIGKKEIDNLQLWADDISQLIERTLNPHGSGPAARDEDADLIGSRFFNKTRHSQGSGTDSAASTVTARRAGSNEETNVKVAISEVAVTISLPRETGIRPMNLSASDIDLLLELRPEGKEETVITLGVADLSVRDTSEKNAGLLFLGSTTPRNMASVVQPLLKLRFTSLVVSDSAAKESRIKVTVCGATYTLYPDLAWITDIARFVKAPPGVFESVVPSERTRLSIKVVDSSIRGLCPSYPGAMVLHLGELEFSSVMVGNLPETSFNLNLQAISLLLLDDLSSVDDSLASSSKATTMSRVARSSGGIWKLLGYSLVAELSGLDLLFTKKDGKTPADIGMSIPRGDLRLHLCADTGTAIGGFIGDFSSIFSSAPEVPEPPKPRRQPTVEIAPEQKRKVDLTASIEEDAFQRTIPEVGATPDMVNDDVPTNPDYLDDSFSATAGLRELDDEDLEDFSVDEMHVNITDQIGLISAYGGETIRLLDPKGLHVEENYFETLPPEANDESAKYGETTFKLRVNDCGVTVFLYGGYDWARTRRIIEEEAKEMRRRLAKIRQLVADGQTPDPTVEETNTLLFNSVYIGLEHNVDELEPGDLIAAIDEELNEDLETASQSSWQSLKPQPTSPKSPEKRLRRSKKGMTRSKGPSIEFRLEGLSAEVDNYRSHKSLASRILVTIRDAEIFDHIKTSTWSKFLTSLHTDSRGNIRETGSNMVRFELRKVYPVPGNPATEARLRAKILPIRLHVDQDALDFMKKFFAFKDPEAVPSAPSDPADEIFFQRAEVFPVDLKLDFKPRRVDYKALREGKTIELMNFFHFDGAEMTLRHITLNGVTGWARLGDLLNDLWTPDVKATQLVEVISGVAPIRSVVNVGSGVADLVLLPIAQYKKDGRVVRGLQKGTTAFVKSTATEAIKLGARLATGTQVILEQAEHVIGGQFDQSVTAEALQLPVGVLGMDDDFAEGVEADDLISRYADQPAGVKDGVKSAYKSLRRNLTSAAQTILAVPMEVYERSGNEGTMRAVVRAVPIAVLRPMIGASEAVSKTLLGLHNTLDPNVRTDNEAKYKQR